MFFAAQLSAFPSFLQSKTFPWRSCGIFVLKSRTFSMMGIFLLSGFFLDVWYFIWPKVFLNYARSDIWTIWIVRPCRSICQLRLQSPMTKPPLFSITSAPDATFLLYRVAPLFHYHLSVFSAAGVVLFNIVALLKLWDDGITDQSKSYWAIRAGRKNYLGCSYNIHTSIVRAF